MARRRKFKWSDMRPLDDAFEQDGDTPEGFPGWLVCPECDEPMTYYDEGFHGYFECSTCGLRIDGGDAGDEDQWDGRQSTKKKPYECSRCGGPWPDCMEHCTLIDI